MHMFQIWTEAACLVIADDSVVPLPVTFQTLAVGVGSAFLSTRHSGYLVLVRTGRPSPQRGGRFCCSPQAFSLY